jgi:DNA ligase-1
MTQQLSTEIYKLDSKGKIRTWQYVVEGDSWWTIAGLRDGKKVVSKPTVCVPASQATAEEQALFEAKAEEFKKLKRDYHLTVGGTAVAKYFKPMLAEPFEESGPTEEGDLASPKLDGIRCFASKDGLKTRKGEPILSCPHVIEDLADIFARNPTLTIDGELYNHAYKDNFNKLASIIRKTKPDADEVATARRDIEFHVYDLVVGDNFAMPAVDRNTALTNIVAEAGPSIELVPTTIVNNDEELAAFFSECVELGYEGAMRRRHSAGYEQKRTTALAKYKGWITAEFPVSRIIEGKGNWAGLAKSVEIIMPNDARTEKGERPRASVTGDQDFARELLTRNVKFATVRFQGLTPIGVPRFATAIDFDRTDL